ncbi:MAG: F0F1 ATP synthase subunit B, partial [Microgenomates group bacterium]
MVKTLFIFSYGLFFWQAIILVILIVLLAKFAWKPILTALAAREEGISNALLAAENAKKDMQNLKADNEKLLAEARAERDLMIKEAREIKEKMIADAK